MPGDFRFCDLLTLLSLSRLVPAGWRHLINGRLLFIIYNLFEPIYNISVLPTTVGKKARFSSQKNMPLSGAAQILQLVKVKAQTVTLKKVSQAVQSVT